MSYLAFNCYAGARRLLYFASDCCAVFASCLMVKLARAVLCCIRLLHYCAKYCIVFDLYVSAPCLCFCSLVTLWCGSCLVLCLNFTLAGIVLRCV